MTLQQAIEKRLADLDRDPREDQLRELVADIEGRLSAMEAEQARALAQRERRGRYTRAIRQLMHPSAWPFDGGIAAFHLGRKDIPLEPSAR